MGAAGRTKKQAYLYRKKLLRRQEAIVREISAARAVADGPVFDAGRSERLLLALGARAREHADRMVRHGLGGACELLDWLAKDVMES